MRIRMSLRPVLLGLLVWMALPFPSPCVQDAPRVPPGESSQGVQNDHPIWMKQLVAAAMLLSIILVISVFLRRARGGWEAGKRQAEIERIRRDLGDK